MRREPSRGLRGAGRTDTPDANGTRGRQRTSGGSADRAGSGEPPHPCEIALADLQSSKPGTNTVAGSSTAPPSTRLRRRGPADADLRVPALMGLAVAATA